MTTNIVERAKTTPAVPLAEFIGFRCPKQMSSGLKTYALANGIEYSAVIRALLADGCERHGINIKGY